MEMITSKELRILILEDVPADAELMERELRRAGIIFSARRVDTEETFLKELKDFAPDLILADYSLPTFDGLSAVVIAREKFPDVPFILVSGAIGEELAIEILKKGATDYVLKDRLSRLVPVINRVLREAGEQAERKDAEEKLKEIQRQQKAILDNIPDIAWLKDEESRFIAVNEPFGKACGVKPEDLVGKTDLDIWPKELAERYRADDREVMESRKRKCVEEPLADKERKIQWIETIKTPIYNDKGEVIGTTGIARDITERKRVEEEMKNLSMSVEQSTDWVVITDREGNIEYINKAVEKITGYKREELIGENPRIWRSGKQNKKFYKKLWDTILSGSPFPAIFINRKRNGELFYLNQTITPLRDEQGNITHFVSTGKDITEQKFMEEKLNHLAYYDALTELPNRNLFIDRLKQGLARADFHRRLVAVLVIDIDRFKFINDTFGLDTGDNILKKVAGRLAASVREGDTVARLGSDEFGIVLIDIAHSKDIIFVVEMIMKNVSQTIKFNGREIVLTLSIGISVYPDDGKDVHELIKNAELAFSKAKQQGRKTYQFYTADMNVKASEFVLMEKHLFNALKNDEFILYYQPYWDINTKKIVGMEALLRWQSREFGLVLPGKFIPVLEETGMIIEVGEWILKTACRQVMEWHDKGYPKIPVSLNLSYSPTVSPASNIPVYPEIPVSVNLSLIQFRQKDLTEILERIIRESGVDPKLLTMEITESTFMQDIEFTSSVLKKIKDMGISISVDDFGTGYSSLSYLKRLPIDNLKIDISFIRDIATDPDTASIVTAIISMAHTLNLKTIAEGVETEEQWKILRLLRCDMGQGYYYSPPLPAKDLEKILIYQK
jgi:diguanylate cyclase (GGDEF)-like protein/PAS domain S-box-containing protein